MGASSQCCALAALFMWGSANVVYITIGTAGMTTPNSGNLVAVLKVHAMQEHAAMCSVSQSQVTPQVTSTPTTIEPSRVNFIDKEHRILGLM
jgi:hypothetical protein